MSRLTDAIDANRRGETVPPRSHTSKNNAAGKEAWEERATSRAPSPVSWTAPQINPTGQSRLEQAIDASRRGETVLPGTYTPQRAIVPSRYYRPAAVGTEPAQSQKPVEKPRKATLYDMTIGSIKRGYDNAVYGRELYKDMTGQENQADEYAQKMAGDEYNFEAGGFLSRALSGGMELLGQQVRQWTDPLSVGIAGTAATGAAIAGQAGPQVLVPEEVITVPGAFLAGLQVGSTKANFEIEAGHAYKEMLDNGISEETASKIATGVGIGNAALEFVQLDELAKSFKILDKIGADESIIGAVKRELARRGVDIAKETAQEVAQEGVTIAGTQIGSQIDTGKWAYDRGEVLGRLGDTATSSALSFGALNVPGGAYNVYQQTAGKGNQSVGENAAENIGANFQEMGDDVVLATIQEGLASDPSTRSYQLAQQLQQKLDAGETVTNAELGHLYQANVQAIDAEDGSGDLLLRAAEEVTQKGRVTNNTAIDILSNPTAINTLTQEAGLNISEDMSKSQQRKAVKNAVAALARTQSDVSTNARETAPAATEARQTATQEAVRPAMQVEQQRPAAQQAYDIRRVQSAATSLGERGAKALTAAYDGSMSADTFYAGFASYYEAGVSGMDMGKVRSEYGAQLSAAQKYAAYVAGQNDAERSLRREQQAAPYAKSAGNGSGLVYDDFVRQAVESGRTLKDRYGTDILDANGESRVYLSADTASKINSVAKSLGVRVRFVDSISVNGQADAANAQITGAEVQVQKDNENPVMFLIGHEMTHRMQELAPAEYRAFREVAANDRVVRAAVEKQMQKYARRGIDISYEAALDEATADYAGRLIDGGKVLDDFIEGHREDRTLLEKVRDAIRAIIRKLTGAERRAAQTAEGKLTAALEAASAQAERLQGNSDGATMRARNSLKSLTEAERGALLQYKSSESYKVNAKLRDGIALTEAEQAMVDELDRALEKLPRVEGTVYRTLNFDDVFNPQEEYETFIAKHQAGLPVAYKAYTSASTKADGYPLADGAKYGVTLEITSRNARDLSGFGNNFESEALFPRRSVFDIARVTTEKNGHTRIYMEEVQINGGDKHQGHDTQKRGVAVRDLQEAHPAHADLQGIPGADTRGDHLRGENLQGAGEKVKFSLKSPVEEIKNLIALHNKDERSIMAALRLGGLTMPSIAVVKAELGHTKYGPISLVFDKATIDPEADNRNKVYGGDAWTPTAPQVDYPVNSKKAAQVERELHKLAGDVSVAGGIFGNSAVLRSMGIDDTSTSDTAELAEKLARTDTVRAAYLADHGQTLEPVKMDKVWDKYGNDTLQKVIDRIGVNELAAMEANLELGESVESALGENADTIRDILREYYREHGEALLRRMAVKKKWTAEEISKNREARVDRSMENSVTIFTLENIVRHAWDMYQDGGATRGDIDRMATSEALRDAVDDSAVETWIAGKLDGVLGEAGIYNGKEPYTASGNRRSFSQLHYAYTLENIVKAMKEGQEERGGNTWGASAKTLQSVATPEYRNIQEIKADSGRLGLDDGAEYDAKLQAIDDQIDSIIATVKRRNAAHSDNPFMESDIIGSVLMEAANGKKTVDAIMRTFSDEGYKISSKTAQDIQAVYKAAAEMPTGYLEAKPRRAVGFDEVLAAVLPDDASDELREALSGKGVNVLTYKAGDDADRIAKVNSVEGARFSLKEDTVSKSYAAILEENELLRERVEYWKGQTRRTKRVTTDKKAVARAARELIRSYGADLDAGDIVQDLQSLYDYLASGYDGKDELTYTEARRRVEDIARNLVENAVAVDETYEQYSDLRAYLRSTTLSLSEEDSRDIPDYGDWRKHQMGRMVIRKGHTNIDQVYQEMSELWPEFFNEQRENNPVDQLLHIAEVMDGIYNVEEYNPFGPYMQQAITGAANEIMEQFFDLPQTRATFSDRQARKLDDAKAKGRERVQKVREQNAARLAELRRQNRERTAKAVERERTRRAEQIGKLKQRYKEKDAAGRERRSARELRAKIMRHASALSQKLLRPSDKQHIPETLRQAVAAMLESINLESAYTTDPNTGKRVKDGSGTPTKRTEAFRALKEQYEAIRDGKTDFTGTLDPELVDNLAELIKAKDTPLADMSTTQLATVWNTLKAVEASVNSANKLFHKGRFSGVEEMAAAIQESSRGKRAKNNYGGNGLGKVSGFGDQLLNVDMLNPLTFLHLFGEGGDALYRELQEARDRKTDIMEHTAELVQEVIGKADISAMQEKTHTFQVSGGEITLSTAQLMSLYELTKREQAQDHIYKGGLRPTEQKHATNLLGKLDNPPDGVTVDQGDVSRMLGALTEQEIKIADGLQAIMQGYLADEGNRESMKVFGYRKFTEDHYFPINSDPNHVQTKIGDILEGGVRRPVSVAEWGSAKGTTKGANNGLLLGDIFDVFAQHAVDMSTYASHLGALEDVNRVRNFTFRNEEGDRTGQMKSIIQRVAGQHGNAYLDKLLQDISRGTAKGGVTGLSRLTANYKAASVGLNLRVALQQPTSYARALAVMDGKYLADPRVMKKGGWEKALKYAPIARWKDWGNFEVNQGRQFQDILFGTDSKLERARNASMKLASAMDSLTWGRIWNACELETADLRRDLTRGSEGFYRAVAQRFTDVVDQTQVVDNVLGRSQFMRSGDNLAKMASSYMGEPTQSYNLFYRAYRDAVQEQDPAKRRQGAKRMGRAAGALVFSMFLNAVAQSLWDAVRDDDDRDEKYWERVLGHILPNFSQNINPMGMVPYLRDVLSILQGYDVERMDLAAVTGLVQAAKGMQKALNGEGRYTVIGAGANLVAELSRVVGLPAATVKRDMLALARSMGIETGDWYFQYQIERSINSLGYSGNRKEFYDIAFGALSAGELDVYQQIAADMMTGGVKATSIEAAMRDRLEAAQAEDPAFALSHEAKDLIGNSERYGREEKAPASFGAGDLDPAAYARYNAQRAETYRTWANELEQSAGFRRMNDAGKDKALDAVEKLAEHLALIDHSQGQVADSDLAQWERWATNGEAWGVDPTEAILFKAAYDMTEGDKDEDGKTISGSKKENTLEAAEELLPGLTDEELEYLMSNFWKPDDRELSEMRERGFMP